MSYYGHICKLPWTERPMGPCPACEYDRKMTAANAPMPDAPGDEMRVPFAPSTHRLFVTGEVRTLVDAPATDTPAETRDEEPERDWTPTTTDDVQWLREFSAIEHLGLYEEERQRLVAIASALAAAREESERDRKHIANLLEALAFAEVCMKCGEGWSIKSAEIFRAARAAPGTP